MPFLNRWGPVIGGAILVVATGLSLFGQGQLAAALLGIGAALGFTNQSPVPAGEITAALTQFVGGGLLTYGIIRKLWAAATKAKAPAVPPKP